ncbi:MAG: adenylyl-sulfate kinase, partial [Mucilaginibacter sp.]
AVVAATLSRHNIIPIICAINPYDDVRQEIANQYENVKTVYLDCSMNVLMLRDTKLLYRRALLPDDHPEKVNNLSGVNDPFEIPANPDLIIKTDAESIEASSQKLLEFILSAF